MCLLTTTTLKAYWALKLDENDSPTSTVWAAKIFLNLATRAASVALPPGSLELSDPLPLQEVSNGYLGDEAKGSPLLSLASLVKLC